MSFSSGVKFPSAWIWWFRLVSIFIALLELIAVVFAYGVISESIPSTLSVLPQITVYAFIVVRHINFLFAFGLLVLFCFDILTKRQSLKLIAYAVFTIICGVILNGLLYALAQPWALGYVHGR
jgi:hypothetical protein